jgi:hypothetical protein
MPFFGNEGVTIWCGMHVGLIDLFSPGRPDIAVCTYDHQPLYHVWVKFLLNFMPIQKEILRAPNLFIYFLSFYTSFKIFEKFKVDKLQNFIINYLLFSSSYLTLNIIHIRMYSVFLLGSLISYYGYLRLKEKSISLTTFNIINVFFHLNFYFHNLAVLPLYLFYFTRIKREKTKITHKDKFSLFVYLSLIVYKIPYIYEWRFITREKYKTPVFTSQFSLENLFFDFIIPLFNSNILLCFVLFIITIISIKRNQLKRIAPYVLIMTLMLFLKYGFQIQEIEPRYLIFLPFFLLYISPPNIRKTKFKLSILLIIMTNHYFVFKEIKPLMNEQLMVHNNELDNLLKENTSNSQIICTSRRFLYDFILYDLVYFNLQNERTLHLCQTSSPDFILTMNNENPKDYLTIEQNQNTQFKLIGEVYKNIPKKYTIPPATYHLYKVKKIETKD